MEQQSFEGIFPSKEKKGPFYFSFFLPFLKLQNKEDIAIPDYLEI